MLKPKQSLSLLFRGDFRLKSPAGLSIECSMDVDFGHGGPNFLVSFISVIVVLPSMTSPVAAFANSLSSTIDRSNADTRYMIQNEFRLVVARFFRSQTPLESNG